MGAAVVPSALLFCSFSAKTLPLLKVNVIHLLDVYIYYPSIFWVFPFPADIEA